MAAPLDDITVIEIDSYMAAPSTGAILADLGANVIKVEPLTGDPMRGAGRPVKIPPGPAKDYDYCFDVDNRGKRSIAVALDTDAGADVVRKLVAGAQVFMCNLLPERQARFGLDSARLLQINPTLVHATLTGYGSGGPDAGRPGYDVTAFFGRSGLYDSMREGPQGTVPMARPAQGDHTTGLAMLGSILAALRMAERSGKGQVVETSLYETAVWTQATDFSTLAIDAAEITPRARENLFSPTANRYPCGDGKWVVINMPGEAAWRTFCRTIGRDEWLTDPRLQDMSGRFKVMPELVAGIDATLSTKTRDEWGEIFDAAKMIWGPVLRLHEVVGDRQADAIDLFPVTNHPDIGDYRTVRAPMRFHTADVGPRGPAPTIGQHTREILKGAGIADAEISQLFEQGAVADKRPPRKSKPA